jgi:hypothetical protein
MYSVGITDRSKNDGMLDVGNSVGLGHDDDGDNDDDDDTSKSSGLDVGVSASTIDGGDDVEAVDSDGVPERSKNDGMLDDDNSVGLDDVVGDDDDDSDGVEGILLAE